MTLSPELREARFAPLEQLSDRTRELAGGILAIDTAGSRLLLDVVRSRYQHVASDMDAERASAFGIWEPLESVEWHEPWIVVVPPPPAARVRISVETTAEIPTHVTDRE